MGLGIDAMKSPLRDPPASPIIASMSVALAKATLSNLPSEDDFTLSGEGGEYFVDAADRSGPLREFVGALFNDTDGELFHDLTTGNVPANFLTLMEALAASWGDEFVGEVVYSG